MWMRLKLIEGISPKTQPLVKVARRRSRMRSWQTTILFSCLAKLIFFVAAAAAQGGQSSVPVAPSGPAEPPQNLPPGAAASPEQPISPQHPESGGFVFKKQVQEVVLRAVVVDGQNNLLSSLNR